MTEGTANPPDPEHLGVRAFGLLALAGRAGFEWTDRIPRASGLGSSAATIALGLVAAAKWAGQELTAGAAARPRGAARGSLRQPRGLSGRRRVPDLGAGGWRGSPTTLPLTPVVVIPQSSVLTSEARWCCPPMSGTRMLPSTSRAPRCSAPGIAQGDPALLAAAFADRLHEPYRPSPILTSIRADLPAGAVGATLSGSGPSVIAWATDAGPCAAELAERFPEETVMVLPVSPQGAH